MDSRGADPASVMERRRGFSGVTAQLSPCFDAHFEETNDGNATVKLLSTVTLKQQIAYI